MRKTAKRTARTMRGFLKVLENGNPLVANLRKQLESNSTHEVDTVLESFARVSIFAQKWQVKVETVVPLVNFETFLSNIGGLMGMWLGLSVISIIDLLEKSLLGFLATQGKHPDEKKMTLSKVMDNSNTQQRN